MESLSRPRRRRPETGSTQARARAGLAGLACALVVAGAAFAGSSGTPAQTAKRLAVLAPAAAETLDALGAADRVVAVGDFITDPPALARLPKLGSYDAPSAEQLVSLGVDVLVTSAGVAGSAARHHLASLGIEVVELDTESYASALASIERLGRLVDREERARRLVGSIEARVAAVEARTKDLPRRTTLIVVGREPLFVAGNKSYLARLLAAAGGANVAGDLASAYAQVSLEAILERKPEVILDTSDNRPGAPRGRMPGPWGRWPFLPAVIADRVFYLDPGVIAIPGPRMGEIAERLGRLLRPELFGAPTSADYGTVESKEGR